MFRTREEQHSLVKGRSLIMGCHLGAALATLLLVLWPRSVAGVVPPGGYYLPKVVPKEVPNNTPLQQHFWVGWRVKKHEKIAPPTPLYRISSLREVKSRLLANFLPRPRTGASELGGIWGDDVLCCNPPNYPPHGAQ